MKTSRILFSLGLAGLLVFSSAIGTAATTADAQKNMTPQQAFEALLEGNDRFVHGLTSHRDLSAEVDQTSTGQYPLGVVLTCLDSRTAPETMFDQGIGDLFGSFEFAHKLAGAKVLAVVGHSSCGAVKGACDGAKMGNLTHTLAQLSPALDAVPASVQPRNAKNPAFVQKVADANVRLTVDRVLDRS